MDHERFVLSLLDLPRVARKTAWKVVRAAHHIPTSPDDLYEVVIATNAIQSMVTKAEVAEAWCVAERMLDATGKAKVQVLAATRTEFPAWLQAIPDPPLVLFIRGNGECIKTPESVAIVGTREPTEYGEKVAHRFGQRGAEAGYVVISGLATGCDWAGHRGCLDAGGRTVAVLAHGLDRVYPKESRELADEILEKGGCWVSEYPVGMRAQRSYFVERDRIQSGMSGGVIVVETDTDGGTMHTVRFAETQGRPVACLVHPKQFSTSEKVRGNTLLISEKRAKPLTNADDLCAFFSDVRHQAGRWNFPPTNSQQPSNSIESEVKDKDLFSEAVNNAGSPF